MNKLIIGKKLVELETDIVYQAIEISYYGKLYIENLLPNDYIVQKNNSKIIIIKFNKREEILSELFNYNGYCNISYAYLVDKDLNKHELSISKPAKTIWRTLAFNWDISTTKYEDMKNVGANNYTNTLKHKAEIDPDTGVVTQTKETGRKVSNLSQKDINLTTLEGLGISSRKTKKATKTRQKIKKGY